MVNKGGRRSKKVAVASLAVVVLVLFGLAKPASATWSIVAVDPETGQVGAVMASCVDPGILGDADQALIPIVLAPGAGVGVTQGTINWDAPAEMRELLLDELAATDVVDFLVSGSFEANPAEDIQVRQYGVVTFPNEQSAGDQPAEEQSTGDAAGQSAVFTGEVVEGERQAVAGKNVAAQGLLLTDVAVINDAVSAYAAAVDNDQPMEQALVEGLVAGAEAGGDRRCGDQTALFAQLVVAESGDDPLTPSTLLTVTVDEGDGQNPVLLLADSFDEGATGWVDAGQRSSAGVPKLWAAVVAGAIGIVGALFLQRGMGNRAARR